MPRYRTLILDLDGTLIDSYDGLMDAINFVRADARLEPLSRNEIKRHVGDGVEKLLERAFAPQPVPPDAQRAFEARYDLVCCEHSHVLDDVEETLGQLAREGFLMGVCTNKPTGFSRKILDALDLSRLFGSIVGPDLAGARKPDPRHVLQVLEALGGSVAETLFVGDMPVDVEAARACGIDVAVIATGSATAEALEKARPDYVLERFSDLLITVREGEFAPR